MDFRVDLRAELAELRPVVSPAEAAEPMQWAYFPWRRMAVSVLGPLSSRRLRLDRNRNKITAAEQHRLGRLTIGVVGLSVGHAIAHTLALEGLCGRLKLADYDSVALSNLNRIPATVMDVGINKAVVVARRIAELDPYLPVEVFPAGLTDESMSDFFDGLDLVVEECDSLDMKIRIRQEARSRRIPVFMETSDRGLIDVERFDLEPARPLFHGLLGTLDPQSLRNLSTRDKAPQVMRILQTAKISARMAASMVEIDRTVSTWPQLGSEVQLGAATIAAAVRRFGTAGNLNSGRIRIDLESQLDHLAAAFDTDARDIAAGGSDLTASIPAVPLDAVIHAIRLAPSGGNSQPWAIDLATNRVDIRLVPERTSAMDVGFRGSWVAIGAAALNARVAAARHSILGAVEILPARPSAGVAVSLQLGERFDQQLSDLYPAMVHRITNRNHGRREALSAELIDVLRDAAEDEGAQLHLVTEQQQLAVLADVLAESDRIRFLTPLLHQQMISELSWPERDRMDLGIDVRTLGLDAADLAKLQVASRRDVMVQLASWRAGRALGDDTRDRVNASSALAVITVARDDDAAYIGGGMAAERVWILANQYQLSVQPMSPVFLYARTEPEIQALSDDFSTELGELRSRFDSGFGLTGSEVSVLVFRLSHHTPTARRSERLSLEDVVGLTPASENGLPSAWSN